MNNYYIWVQICVAVSENKNVIIGFLISNIGMIKLYSL